MRSGRTDCNNDGIEYIGRGEKKEMLLTAEKAKEIFEYRLEEAYGSVDEGTLQIGKFTKKGKRGNVFGKVLDDLRTVITDKLELLEVEDEEIFKILDHSNDEIDLLSNAELKEFADKIFDMMKDVNGEVKEVVEEVPAGAITGTITKITSQHVLLRGNFQGKNMKVALDKSLYYPNLTKGLSPGETLLLDKEIVTPASGGHCAKVSLFLHGLTN